MTVAECEKLKAENIDLLEKKLVNVNSGKKYIIERIDILFIDTQLKEGVAQCFLQNLSNSRESIVEPLLLILQGRLYKEV